MLIVQFAALHKEVSEAFRWIAYWKILLGLAAGAACSYWFVRFGFGNFLTLLVTACLFFGAYGLVLFITREKLTLEILRQVVEKVLGRVRR
ncbi:MAG: hypothetical protein LUC95_00790 [Lachnospiraceae bacterium]|nr:hypothetical protein [Lachnospiraceae bacterium]